MVLRTYLLTGIYFCISLQLNAEDSPGKRPNYLTITAKSGQGVYGLLRYKLLDNSDNLALFYKINKIEKNAELIKNRQYKLPITVHSYDGKSIRSSIGISDYNKAKRIEQYNEFLQSSNIKKEFFKTDKKIWVPVLIDSKNSEHLYSNVVNSKPAKAINALSRGETDNRKTFLVASVGSLGPDLVADRKLTDVEISELETKSAKKSSSKSSKSFAAKTKNVSLFGSRYENVTISSNELEDQVFYIVPGHGGPDPGAIAKNVDGQYTICEDEYAYDVSLRLAKNLMEKGAQVYIIVQDENDGIRDERYLDCDCDEKAIGGHTIPLNQKKRLKQGISKVNRLHDKYKKKGISKQWMISLHIDAQSEQNRQDVFFYYQSESEISKNKAIDIQKVFEEKYQMYRKTKEYNGTVTSRPLYVVRHSKPEPIFVELANIHNHQDRQRILIPKNRQLLADWITEGFLK
jgi:N-acetylmuramoyl-L-alanine amidase